LRGLVKLGVFTSPTLDCELFNHPASGSGSLNLITMQMNKAHHPSLLFYKPRNLEMMMRITVMQAAKMYIYMPYILHSWPPLQSCHNKAKTPTKKNYSFKKQLHKFTLFITGSDFLDDL
jgi:hypothetical protein